MHKKGLSEKDAINIRKKSGQNILPQKEKFSIISVFLNQFKSPLIYILFIVSFLSLALKEYTNVILILAVIVFNSIMGFFQEYSAQKTLSALKKILRPKTFVIRDGVRKEIDVRDLVPGDLVLLAAGDRVPADGNLLEGVALLINEAILTGEEEAIAKTTNKDTNAIFMGTTVLAGRGLFEVTKTGLDTEMGKIGLSLAEIKEEMTPLQDKLEKFSKRLAIIILIASCSIFLIGIFYKHNPLEMLEMAAILAVAAIPEGLPVVITVILAMGMRKILKKRGLVKRLLSVETLGSTTVICTDKTGTLTEGIMKVTKSYFTDQKKALYCLTVNNNQRSNLEIAIWEYIKANDGFNPQQLFELANRKHEEPFDSEKKYTMTIVEIDKKEEAFIMGAPDIILSFCKISFKEKNDILIKIDEWASEGLRILGMIHKASGNLKEKNNFSFLGLIGIKDPIRRGAKEAVAIAQKAGIKVKIITGDYTKTAEKVGIALGFDLKPENIIDGDELDKISESDLKNRIDDIIIFARVSPHEKMKIIKALQDKGEIVAMTGDGVNDAPALKQADIGVVVGSASDVAKEAGDLILLDNNFETIVAACEEGRLIFSNIKKVVSYALSNSFVEISVIFGAVILNFPAPLTIAQILWTHLICDGPPDIVLGFEPQEKGIMKENPKILNKQNILPGSMIFLIFAISLTVGGLSLFFFWYFYKTTTNLNLARTITFATIAMVDLIYIFAFKNLKKSIIHTDNFFANKLLFLSVGFGFLLLLAAVYLPVLNNLLGTVPLAPWHWILVFGVGLTATVITEAVKIMSKKIKA
jgi:Ca2+-transporting ATPase